MPGNIQNALASTVLPSSLCASFTEEREFRVRESEYPDGSGQRSSETTVSQKRFRLTEKLTVAQWTALRDFYLARRGGTEAFYFYFGLETVPLFNYDPIGANPTGRYTVRFDGDFSMELGVGRIPASVVLVEVA